MANQQETTPTLVTPNEVAAYLSERFTMLGKSIAGELEGKVKKQLRQERDQVALGLCHYWLGAQLNAVVQALVEATDDEEGDGGT